MKRCLNELVFLKYLQCKEDIHFVCYIYVIHHLSFIWQNYDVPKAQMTATKATSWCTL